MSAMKSCPQYADCSAPQCPLDPDVEHRDVLPGESQCAARRTTREQIAAQSTEVLPWRGLLPRERARDARKAAWSALPEDHPRKVALRAMQGRGFPPTDKTGDT